MNYRCKNSDVLNPSVPSKMTNYRFRPDDVVYIPEQDFDYSPGYIRASIAFKSEEAAKTHFWFEDWANKNSRIFKTTVREFLLKHLSPQGMNPFETLNRAEFIHKYYSEYPELKGNNNER